MTEMREGSYATLDPGQAAELAVLVDLEARWENLRPSPAAPAPPAVTTQHLHGKQKAYEAFRAKLAKYNKRHAPPHLAELLLNTPVRLGGWCRAMRDLYHRVEHDPQVPCPVHVVAKAYRWA